jgi:hypothetical protein
MKDKEIVEKDHPLRKLFRGSLEYGLMHSPGKLTAVGYIEEHILCAFIKADNLYKIRNEDGRPLDDIAEMLPEGDVLFNASSFQREFQVHKHIGDFALFILGMFPDTLVRKRGKEFLLGSIIIPGGKLSEIYILQGRRSYRIASEFGEGEKEIFAELAKNFDLYLNVLELARIYLKFNGQSPQGKLLSGEN